MSRKRLSKKQLRRDRFVESTFDWAHWAETHRNQVIGGVVAAALLVVGFLVYRNMAANAEAEAAKDYLTARQSYDAGNFPLAASDLQDFLSRHGGSDFADDAQFFLASAYYRAGQTQEAVQTLRDFLDHRKGSPFAQNARRLLAAAYQDSGQYDLAAQTLREAIDRATYDPLKIQLRRDLAATYLAQQRPDLAADQYRQILAMNPEGDAAEEARREYAELTVKPLGAPSQ